MSRVKITLLTGRSIDQGVGKELGKLTKEYESAVAICEMDPADMKEIRLGKRRNVRVLTDWGSVILRAEESKRAPHTGVAYVPYSLWVNVVIGSQTSGTGMPSYKGVPAELEATEKDVTPIRELLQVLYGK